MNVSFADLMSLNMFIVQLITLVILAISQFHKKK